MTAFTLGELLTDIKSRLTINSTVSDDEITRCVQQAIRQMQQKRYWFLWNTQTITLSSGASSVNVPDDVSVLETVDLLTSSHRYTHGFGFDFLDYVRLKEQYFYNVPLKTRRPEAVAILNRTLFLSDIADQDYNLDLFYTKRDTQLPSQSADTSLWFDDGYDVIRSLAQYIFETTSRQNPNATQEEFLSMRNRLDEQHTFYNRGLF
jgi:hypothetical protein